MSKGVSPTVSSDKKQHQAGPSESTVPFVNMAIPNLAVMPSPVMTGHPVTNIANAMNMNNTPAPGADQNLINSLRNQIEFYFSASNLARDHFLRSHFLMYGGTVVPLAIICQFPKVQRICASFGFRADPLLLKVAVENSQVVSVSPNAMWIGPLAPLPPMDLSVQARVQKQNAIKAQPGMLNRSVSTGSNSGPYPGSLSQHSKGSISGSGNVTRTTSPASSQASAGNAGIAIVGGGSSSSISSMDNKSSRTIVILRDVPSNLPPGRILNAFTVEDIVPKHARPDLGHTWYITFASESDAQRAILLTKNASIDDYPIKARIKSDKQMSVQMKDFVTEDSTITQSALPQKGSVTAGDPNVLTPGSPNRNIPITHLPQNTQYNHQYYRQIPQNMHLRHGGGANYSQHYPQVFSMQPNGIPVGAYPVPYGGGAFVPSSGVSRGYGINPNSGGMPYLVEGGISVQDAFRSTRKQNAGRRKKTTTNVIQKPDNLSFEGQSRSHGSKHDNEANDAQESSNTRAHLNHFNGRIYQSRNHFPNNDYEIKDAFNGNSNDRNYTSKKKKGRKRDSYAYGVQNDLKGRQGRCSKEDVLEAPELLDATIFPALSSMDTLTKADGSKNISASSNLGFSGYADALKQKKSADVVIHKPNTSKENEVESGSSDLTDLEEKIDSLRISKFENGLNASQFPETIAVGALTGTPETVEPHETFLKDKFAEVSNNHAVRNSQKNDLSQHQKVSGSSQTSNGSEDPRSTNNSVSEVPKERHTSRSITTSNKGSLDMANSSWGTKRSFIDVSIQSFNNFSRQN